LLREPWNPIIQQDVPDLYVADFGIASHVQTVGTRVTGQRGTPGYEASVRAPSTRLVTLYLNGLQEIRGKGHEAAFSQKSDVYAFGCILYRLCTLVEPIVLDDIKPRDISMDYSTELLSLISTMLSSERDARPTAAQVKDQLTAIGLQLLQPKSTTCRVCEQAFPTRKELFTHIKSTGHKSRVIIRDPHPQLNDQASKDDPGLTIRGFADAPAKYHYDDNELDAIDPSPCIVCDKHFNNKRQFFSHLYGVHHYRGLNYVLKRKAENDLSEDAAKRDERLAKWIRRDMMRHDN
jgi:serine/threonine protein kinase